MYSRLRCRAGGPCRAWSLIAVGFGKGARGARRIGCELLGCSDLFELRDLRIGCAGIGRVEQVCGERLVRRILRNGCIDWDQRGSLARRNRSTRIRARAHAFAHADVNSVSDAYAYDCTVDGSIHD